MRRFVFAFAIFLFYSWLSGEVRKETALTVYNRDLGVVNQKLGLKIPAGKSEIRVVDVASLIDPTSVHFRSIKEPESLSILEQNYRFDLVSTYQLLWRYTDQEIRILTTSGKAYQGKLLSYDGSTLLIDSGTTIQAIRLTEAIQNIEFPSLPEGLITRPTLVWLLENRGGENRECELSYMTSGINWHAEYVALIDESEKKLDLGAWVSIDNRSGATYENATLKLIAGDVNIIPTGQQPESLSIRGDMEKIKAEEQFQEKEFFEYHMYTLQRKATIRNNEIKQLSLFPNTECSIKKIYVYNGARYGDKIRVNVEFKNEKKNGLGIPLPAGKVRVYKRDNDGSKEFIGEDWVDHTPKDEKVRLFLGNAFDIVGERVQKNYKKISNRKIEYTFEIKIRNHKKENIEVTVVENLYGDWTITEKTHEYTKINARTVEFVVPVAKYEESVLNYTYNYKW